MRMSSLRLVSREKRRMRKFHCMTISYISRQRVETCWEKIGQMGERGEDIHSLLHIYKVDEELQEFSTSLVRLTTHKMQSFIHAIIIVFHSESSKRSLHVERELIGWNLYFRMIWWRSRGEMKSDSHWSPATCCMHTQLGLMIVHRVGGRWNNIL